MVGWHLQLNGHDFELYGKEKGNPLQYSGHLMQRTDPLEKTLMLGKIKGKGEGDDVG